MKKILAYVLPSTFPLMALAQGSDLSKLGIDGLFDIVGTWLNMIVPILVGLAVVWFLYNVFRYMIVPGGDADKAEAKENMVWGIIAIFVMVSVWGLVEILRATFFSGNSNLGGNINLQGLLDPLTR